MTEPYEFESDLDDTDYDDYADEHDDVPGWVETDEPDIDEQFEIESSLMSAGWGTDEDYGYYGEDEY